MFVQSVCVFLQWYSLIQLHRTLHTAQGQKHNKHNIYINFFIHIIYMNTCQDGHFYILSAGFKKWYVYVMEESTVHVGCVASTALQ